MMDEVMIAGVVLAWAEQLYPGQPDAAEGAVEAAIRGYAGGASVSEACREARGFLEHWAALSLAS